MLHPTGESFAACSGVVFSGDCDLVKESSLHTPHRLQVIYVAIIYTLSDLVALPVTHHARPNAKPQPHLYSCALSYSTPGNTPGALQKSCSFFKSRLDYYDSITLVYTQGQYRYYNTCNANVNNVTSNSRVGSFAHAAHCTCTCYSYSYSRVLYLSISVYIPIIYWLWLL